ncbi:MAG: ATP-binding cassette domain-containing protein [Bryobacterales bacterium]|nr:ATP-binding cassette domain-containing protein [Bryobacterales bacterium]MBV9397101.1 ATP-binding cassette domain-containing protein [Bryobacterales bacterium]
MTPDSSVVRFEEVSLHFGATPALDGVSFEMGAGETRILFGAAGSGKTTLLKVAMGLIQPDSGRVFLFGQDITRLSERQMFDLRARVGILFQEGGLFDSLTVEENVAYPLLHQRALQEPLAHTNGATRTVADRVQESLNFVELGQTLEKYPSELSGGMRRRVGIARALVSAPALLLYDSPTAGLDPITANHIVALILKEREERNTATIVVTHRYLDGHLIANFRYNPSSGTVDRASRAPGKAGRVTTKFFVMREGRLVFQGSEAELQAATDPYVRKFQRHGSA